MSETRVKVGELTGRGDFGRGIVRIDSKIMKNIGVKEGDVVEVNGKTSAVAVRAYPADIGLNVIRMDGLLRKNADAVMGDMVTVTKAKVKEAKRVVLAPASQGIRFHVSPNLIRQNLFMRPVKKGDIIIANPVFRRDNGTGGEDIFEQLFGMGMQEVFIGGGETRLVVVKTDPDEYVHAGGSGLVSLNAIRAYKGKADRDT